MKKIVIFISLAIILLFTGCSRSREVSIINMGKNPIYVEYIIDETVKGIFNNSYQSNPLLYSISEDDDEFKIIEEKHGRVSTNVQNKQISFTLQAHEKAILTSFGGAFSEKPTEKNYIKFNLKSLKITTSDSKIIYAEGNNSRYLFKELGDDDFGIIFR